MGLGGLGATVYLFCWNVLPFGHYVDDLKWVLLAESLSHGSTQTAWSAVPLPDTSITWGFSLLLAPLVALWGRQVVIFKLFAALCVIVGCTFFYLSVRKMLDNGGRAFLLVGLGGTGFMMTFSGNVISEAGYLLLFGLIAFFLAQEGFLEAPRWRPLFVGFLTGGLVLVRTVGLVVPFSMGAFGRRFWEGRSGRFFFLGVAIVAGPIFFIMKALSGSFSFYRPYWQFGDRLGGMSLLARFFDNTHFYWKGLSCMTFFNLPAIMGPSFWVKSFFMGVVFLLLLRGMWQGRQTPLGRWLIMYFVGYWLIIGLWTYQAPRYVFPLYPVFLAFVGAGLAGLASSRGGRWGLVCLLAVGVINNAGELGGQWRQSLSGPIEVPHTSEDWLAEHTEPESVVVSMDVATVFYFTGRRGIPFIPSTDLFSFERGARRLRSPVFFFRANDYVPPASGVLDPIAQQHETMRSYLFGSGLFVPVYENLEEKTTIFRLREP